MINVTELDNGIRVVTERMPQLKTAAFGVWVGVGSANETEENNGIAHVVEHMLFKGTRTRTAKQLADEISAIGDVVNAFTAKEMTAFYGVTLSEYLPKLMELLSDMLLNSTFEEEPLKKELSVILEEIDMYDDSPEDLVHELLQKNVWKGHPLGFLISGEKSVVRRVTKRQLTDFMAQHYCGENMVISVAGNFDEAGFFADARRYFGGVPRHGTAASPYGGRQRSVPASAPVFHRCLCEKKKDVEQLYFNLAFNAVPETDERRYVLNVLNVLLGGSNNSRLFQEIREESGLAYSVYSYGSLYRNAGLFQIDLVVNPANALTVYEKLAEILEEFATRPVEQEELAALYAQLRIELVMGSESARNRMEGNAKSLLLHGGVIPLEETLKKLSRVTAEEILEFAAEHLRLAQSSLCLVGDLKSAKKLRERWQT